HHHPPPFPTRRSSDLKYQSNHHNRRRTHPTFPGIAEMDCPERYGKQDRRRPEADPVSQSKLRIPTKEKFFEEANEHKEDRPHDGDRKSTRLNSSHVSI